MTEVLHSGDGVRVVRVSEREELELAWDVRTEVFVHEQHVPVEEEIDELDTAASTTHVLALDEVTGEALGTGRLLSDPGHEGEVHLGRLAVRAAARGRGIGARLVIAIEGLALAGHAAAESGTPARPGATGPGATNGATGNGTSDDPGTLRVRVVLSAQESAIGFYRRLGYEIVSGERYLDAGIWHQDMAHTVMS
ncbi:putative GNAT family N-acyltransferase [Georgenia soli]|uniref:Putative GNAT family N-acyltransferase n=1 Tax=Georgenia soli TaxID=638953 RepID=A0A2A9EHU0_9MICO|nr:GNAT family N-acetyltransferase [Georgenia soli]PFG38393.1 putative GNAT family N-acyltransferase [Georgenia soli]